MSTLLKDLKYGALLLIKSPGFTLVALVTLALAIGANTAIFSVVRGVLLKPLAYPEPDRLVMLYNSYPGVGVEFGSNGVPDYLDRRKETSVFAGVSLIADDSFNLGAEGSPERVSGIRVTPLVLPGAEDSRPPSAAPSPRKTPSSATTPRRSSPGACGSGSTAATRERWARTSGSTASPTRSSA